MSRHQQGRETNEMNSTKEISKENIWSSLREEAQRVADSEEALAAFIQRCVLRHETIEASFSCVLSGEMASEHLAQGPLFAIFHEAVASDPSIILAVLTDLQAHVDRDPASAGYLTPFLYFKGFHALQCYRVAHWLWTQNRKDMALYLQGRCSRACDVDIHPAAIIGRGIMIDHGSGLVVGETAVVEDDVSMLHGVTLGGTGKESGDRHPKIRRGVLLSAGARILGNIEVGEGAKVGASSLVLAPVQPHTTVAGVPAKVVGTPRNEVPALEMHQELD